MEHALLTLLVEKNYRRFKEECEHYAPADIAELMEDLNPKDTLLFFRLLPKDLAVEVFSYLEPSQQEVLSQLINEKELREIMEDLYFDDKIDFLEEMPAHLVKRILRNSPEKERRIINQFLNYPEFSAGSLMTIEYVDLKQDMTVAEAIRYIRHTGIGKETIYTCYVVDPNRKLEGILSLRELLIADDDDQIAEVMTRDYIAVSTQDDQEYIASVFKKYDFLALPVVDKETRLVGIITIDDIVDVIEDENTEDFHKMGALQKSTEEYMEASIPALAKQRIGWLLILMLSATFTGNIIRHFENILQTIVLLAAFIPMLMDTGGNAGAQSSTLIIRGMALGEIQLSDGLKIVRKELAVSFIVGGVLALLNFLRIAFLEQYPVRIAIVVSSTMFLTVVMAKVIGGILPIVAKRMKVDPAIMASPLITTIVDTLSLLVYFNIARLMLNI
jgi:magnesium transporter